MATPAAPPPLALVYINLDEDTQRRAAFQTAFGAADLHVARLAATRWARLGKADQARMYSEELNARSYFRPLVDGEKGCYASHIAAWEHLLSSPAPALVVLEDDVQPMPHFADTLDAIAALDGDWDMVKLIGRGREKPAHRQPLARGIDMVSYRRVPSLTAGYVLNRRGAEKLLATRVPFGRPIDVDLRFWWESDLVVRGVLPAAIALAETQSQSSVGARHGRTDAAQRWRKFVFQLRYSLANARARER